MQGDHTAAKAAVHIFIETARIELKHFGIKHIKLQTIHPGFVATEAVKDDGIPALNEISEDAAANYVLRGIKKEMNENIFPPATKWAAKLGKILPTRLLTKILLSQTPQNF
jgi:short-subunit dehydrogenase